MNLVARFRSLVEVGTRWCGGWDQSGGVTFLFVSQEMQLARIEIEEHLLPNLTL